MEKKRKYKYLKRAICGIGLTSGIVVGSSVYNYYNIDDVYDSVRDDTSKKIIYDYNSYNEENSIDLYDPITAYNMYIEQIASLYNDLHLSNPNDIFMFYSYMKNSGYLSVDKQYNYDVPSFSIYGKKGINVALGTGVCEHEAEMFSDILSAMGFDNYKIICSVTSDNSEYNSNGIKLVSDDFKNVDNGTIYYYSVSSKLRELLVMPIFKLKSSDEAAEHIFNAVKYNDKVYYFDTTNLIKWCYCGDKTWNSLSVNSNIKFDVKASYSRVYTNTLNDVGDIFNYASDNEVDECRCLYEQLYIGEYDMLFNEWHNFIPDVLFESMKTLDDIKRLRR